MNEKPSMAEIVARVKEIESRLQEIKPDNKEKQAEHSALKKELMEIVREYEKRRKELHELGKVIEKNSKLMNITQTAGLSDVLYMLPRITKSGEIVDNFINTTQVYKEKKHEIDLEFSYLIQEALIKSPVITENHVKVFACALSKHADTGQTRVLIDYETYFKLKQIKDTKENRKKLTQEIKELEQVEFDYRYKENGKWKKASKARILMYTETRRNEGIVITFGAWVDYLPDKKTYIQIDKSLFKLPVKNNKIGPITILLKLRELNSMSKNVWSVSGIIDLKQIDDSVFTKEGFLRIKKAIENDLKKIEEETTLKWKYRNGTHKSRQDFEADYIEFTFAD